MLFPNQAHLTQHSSVMKTFCFSSFHLYNCAGSIKHQTKIDDAMKEQIQLELANKK